jgi:spermidine/putrescine transport system ATP-binding protein
LSESTKAAAPSPELGICGVSKRFGSVVALDAVDLTIAGGRFVTLLGPSGCGKTTLLRIIAGLELADAGSVTLGGTAIDALPAHRRPVNTVFQNYALFPHLDVFENIAFGLRARRLPRQQISERVKQALSLLHLDDLARRFPQQLSGGQKQRVALARALVNRPQVLLLDEPMSALDAKLRGQLQAELRNLQRQLGTTFILVTHDQDEAMTVSDEIFVMRSGRIEQSGSPADIYEHPVNAFVATFLGAATLIEAKRIAGSDGMKAATALGNLRASRPLPWEKGTLAIRPERVRLCRQEAAENSVRIMVTDCVYRGDHTDVSAEPGGLRLRVSPAVAAEFAIAPGSELIAHLPAEHLELLRG